MNHLNYIYTNEKNIIANEPVTFNYNGFLKDSSNNIYMRYTTNNWETTNEAEMKNEDGVFKAEITMPNDANNIEFAFKNEMDAWDNNYEANYNFEVLPSTLKADSKDSMDVEYFESDYLLKHNLNAELEDLVSESPAEFSVSKGGEVIDPKKFKLQVEEFDAKVNAKIDEIKAAMFETLNEKVEQQFENLEELEPKEDTFEELEDTTIRFIAKEPYVKMFKEKMAKEELEKVNANYIAKEGEYLYTSKVKYAEALRTKARENLLKFEIEQTRQSFLVVSPYSNLEKFDNSILGKLQKAFYIIKVSLKRLGNVAAEGMGLKDTF